MVNKRGSRFENWLVEAKPNSQFIYFRGFTLLTIGGVKRREGREAWEAYKAGLVRLHVRRCPEEPKHFDYIAVKREPADQLINARRHLV